MNFDIVNWSKKDLEKLKILIQDKDLESKIDLELIKRNKNFEFISKYQYSSNRLPNYKDEYNILCNQLLFEYNLDEFKFLTTSFFERTNNKKGDFVQPLYGFTETNFDKKWKNNLAYLSILFQNQAFIKGYEGVYNTLNYLINSLYKEVDFYDGKIYCKKDLFSDISSRKEVVRDNFVKIVEELWQTRDKLSNSKLSICNYGLTKNRNKKDNIFSVSQEALIEAIAYGCSLNELVNNDFEGAKRLIYVPIDKIR